MRRIFQILLALTLSAAPGTPGAVAQEEPPPPGLSPQEERGKQIYLTCESPTGGEIVALMGGAGVEVPGSALPCANCHARDGKGNPEGGVTPTDLTWASLTRPYGVSHASGREHPPYDERSLKRAISMGLDPAGNSLHVAMPRYRMSLEDMEALVAYLKRLGDDPDPGVSPDALRLGTLLPPDGPLAEVGGAIESVLAARFAEINAGGGVYGRRLELVSHRLAADPAARPARVGAFLDEQEIFALVGAFLAGSDADVPALLAEREVPLVGPFTLRPQIGFPLNRQVFYLFSGLPTQARVLVDVALERHPPGAEDGRRPMAVVVFAAGGEYEAEAAAAVKQAEAAGWTLERREVAGAFDAEGLARELAGRGAGVVLLFHPEGLDGAFLAAAGGLDWYPEIYAPGIFAGEELLTAPAGFDGKLFLSFPVLPANRSPQAAERYRRLTGKHGLPRGNLATQLATLAAADILLEGLQRAGRDLSREKLVEALEQLYEHPTGLTPPITYGPNRRIGALGAYVVTADLAARRLQPQGGWREPR